MKYSYTPVLLENCSRVKKEVLIEYLFLGLVVNIQSYLGNIIFTFNVHLKFYYNLLHNT